MNAFAAAAGVGIVVMTCSGCSWIFVKSAPDHPERLPPTYPLECTRGKAAPILDTIGAGLQAARTGIAIAADRNAYHGAPISKDADILIGAGLTAIFVASAIHGYSSTSECARLFDERQQRPIEHEPRAEPGAPPPPPVTPAAAPMPPAPAQPARSEPAQSEPAQSEPAQSEPARSERSPPHEAPPTSSFPPADPAVPAVPRGEPTLPPR